MGRANVRAVFGVVVVVVHGNGGGLRYAGGNNIGLANIGASSNIFSLAEGCALLYSNHVHLEKCVVFSRSYKILQKNRDIL